MKLSTPILLVGSSLLIMTAAVNAQTGAGDAALKPEFKLEEIVVTARRRAESLEDVPQAIDAVTSETIEKLNLLSFQDVQSVVPGLTLSSGSTGIAASASVRGVTFDVESSTTPAVAGYLNDALVDPSFLFQSLFDIGRIEILRGPQGTLRGRSAPSGAITVTTHGAELSKFGGYASITASDRHEVNGQGALNLPVVTDVLAIRLAGVIDDNRYDEVRSVNDPPRPHAHTAGERVSLRFVPLDAFNLDLTYQHLERTFRRYHQVTTFGALPTPADAVQNGPDITAPRQFHQTDPAARSAGRARSVGYGSHRSFVFNGPQMPVQICGSG